ncbi:hypothetical protein SKAU_G00322160 [Synaphobranchus kaupii]|uniref:BZIP domain-containing protein n=1 Tax=Synaphobranchus kaupii TaxID=118154 RepID=A0A9Q1EP37_SYNKA|nr:hypothetical protein SKAU_G00322160 [Synaphobranchus kaupii]
MYRNFGNFSRGSDQSSGTGSPTTTGANSRTVDSDTTTTQPQQPPPSLSLSQLPAPSLPSFSLSHSLPLHHPSLPPPQQKFPLGGPANFVPSLNAITSSQDLQWLVQPSLWPQPGPSTSPLPPYPTQLPQRRSPPPLLHYPAPEPRGAMATSGSTRRRPDEQFTPEELERRRIRRERNKMAAAKCRNRRRVLTDTLQTNTKNKQPPVSKLCLRIKPELRAPCRGPTSRHDHHCEPGNAFLQHGQPFSTADTSRTESHTTDKARIRHDHLRSP